MSATISSAAGLTEQSTQPTQPTPDFATVIHGAVNPERLTHDEVAWGFFQHIHFAEQRKPGSAAAFLEKDVGMPIDAARSLVMYALDSYAQNSELMTSQLAKLCDDFANGRMGSIAERLAAEELIASRFQQGRIAGLTAVLDAETQGRLDSWIAANFTPSLSIVKVDYEKMLSHPGAAVAMSQRMKELCSGGAADVDGTAPK